MSHGGADSRRLRLSDRRFAVAALRKKRLFLGLSLAGIAVALGLALFYGYRRAADPDYPLGLRSVVILLVLLNARQNLRQYRYVRVLETVSATILGTDERDSSSVRGAGDA